MRQGRGSGPLSITGQVRRFRELGDFTTVDRRTVYLSLLSVVTGLLAAIAAAVLLDLIGFFTNLFYYHRVALSFVSPSGSSLGLLAVGIPVFGGLVVGLMARFGSDKIRGHGIPEALESILVRKSRIEPRMTLLKPLSAAISIGSGGPFGAEGPIIMTGGSLGSVFGQALHLSAAERKTLLVAGAAGGMAATFNSPVAAVLVAVELLLFEWRPRSLLPVGVSSITATVLRWRLIGINPLFPLSTTAPTSLSMVGGALLVGLIAGGVATALTFAVYGFEDLFRKLPVHWMWWPAIGGVFVGLGGLVDPRALGVGYDSIDLLLVGGIGIVAVALLLLVKGAIWTISLGSGTSGGVLAPLLMMGAATGTLVGVLLPVGSPVLWALVAMAAILGGTMRAPFTGAIFAIELTRDLNVLLPLFVACLASEGVTIFTLRRSILTEKVARRGVHVAREYAVDPLETTPVSAVMHTDILHVPADLPVGEVVRLAPDITSRYVGYTVLAHGGGIRGFTTKDAIVTYLAEGGDPMAKIESLARTPSRVLYPDHPCRVGAALLAALDVEALPVNDPDEPVHVVGLFAREDLFRARVVALEEELQRDRTLRVTIPSLRWYRGPLGKANPSRPEETAPRDSGCAPNPPPATTHEKERATDPSEASAQPPPGG